MKIDIAGQNAFILYFADRASAEVSAQIQAAVAAIQRELEDCLVDLVPSYASLLVIYDIDRCDHYAARARLRAALANLEQADSGGGDLVTLPVYYSTESGPDLEPEDPEYSFG